MCGLPRSRIQYFRRWAVIRHDFFTRVDCHAQESKISPKSKGWAIANHDNRIFVVVVCVWREAIKAQFYSKYFVSIHWHFTILPSLSLSDQYVRPCHNYYTPIWIQLSKLVSRSVKLATQTVTQSGHPPTVHHANPSLNSSYPTLVCTCTWHCPTESLSWHYSFSMQGSEHYDHYCP